MTTSLTGLSSVAQRDREILEKLPKSRTVTPPPTFQATTPVARRCCGPWSMATLTINQSNIKTKSDWWALKKPYLYTK